MASKTKQTINQSLVKAVSHPLRVEILEAFADRGELSPTQIAKALDQRLGNVSYHVNVLEHCGVIELVRTEPRRGALEHFFRPAAKTQDFIDFARTAFN
jgi:DNA-binding transcriptional ArsR family regulator